MPEPETGPAPAGPRVWVLRHGETEWSRSGQHTSRTDLDLTAEGAAQSRRLGAALSKASEGRGFDLVLCSPMRRAKRTAELAGLADFTVDEELREWDYGRLEGLTTAEVQEEFPGWSIWDGPWPGGESAALVGERADRVVAKLLASGAERAVVVGHGHFSRVLAATWIGADVHRGRSLDLDTASMSELGWSRGTPVLRHWNLVPMHL